MGVKASVSGRSPTNTGRSPMNVDRSHESGPEIQFIGDDMDRRNPMMNMNRGTENSFMNQSKGQNNSNYNPNRSSILTNIKDDVKNPNYTKEKIEENRTREAKKRPTTQDNSGSETSSHVSRNISNQNTNSIVKKMSPNRNNDMNINVNQGANDQNKRNFVRKLSIIADNNNKKAPTSKPEYSMDTRERQKIKKTYNNDLDAIKAMDLKQNNFRSTINSAVSKNPNEGNLYNTKTMEISAMNPHEIADQKNNIKNLNKLSTVLIKDNKSRDPQNKEKTIKSNYKEYTEKTRKGGSASPGKRNIRSTMTMLASKGPNADDKIITRQMRFEKGGVVDLAMNPIQNRSQPKKSEVKKPGQLRSPKTNNRENRISNREKEKSAQIVQSWWRSMLSKYKEVVDKTVIIQKNWRRFFVRKHLYDKLSYYYYFLFIVDKLDNLFRKNDLEKAFSKIYNLNAKEFNAVKYLSSVIYVQRAFRFFKKKKQEKKNALKSIGIKSSNSAKKIRAKNDADDNDDSHTLIGSTNKNRTVKRHKRVNGDDDDDNNDDKIVVAGANKPGARHKRVTGDDDDDNDDDKKVIAGVNKPARHKRVNGDDDDDNNDDKKVLAGANKPGARHRRKGNDDDDDNKLVGASNNTDEINKFKKLRNTLIKDVMSKVVYKHNNQNVGFFLNHWRTLSQQKEQKVKVSKKDREETLNKLAKQIKNTCDDKLRINWGHFIKNIVKAGDAKTTADDLNNKKI